MGDITGTNDRGDSIPLKVFTLEGVERLRVGQIAPAAVHIKELNHVDPITVESLRIDEIRNLDPIRIEKLDITRMPTMNVSMHRMPALDLNVRRVPPVPIGLHQEFELPSRYTVHAMLLGFELMRLKIHGTTRLEPRDRYRREQSRDHERSFPDVSPVGNPAIPSKRIEKCVEARTRTVRCGHAAVPARPHHAPPPPSALSAGVPRYNFRVPDQGATGGFGTGSVRAGG